MANLSMNAEHSLLDFFGNVQEIKDTEKARCDNF